MSNKILVINGDGNRVIFQNAGKIRIGGRTMNQYYIKIDDDYLTGVEDGGILIGPPELAKKIEGNFNLKSYIDRIYEAIRYEGMEFEKIEIVRVGEE